MKVCEIQKYLGVEITSNEEVKSIVTSTQDVEENCILICCKGKKYNPIDYINREIEKKCLLILTDERDTPYQYIPDLKQKVFDLLDYFYFNHEHSFKIIGITGTEGKSSLSDIIYQGLKLINKKALLISNEKRYKDTFLSTLTTPSSFEIIQAMKICQERKYDYLIMEVSCIGISEFRIDGKILDYIFLTNLESDHLDYYDNLYHYHLSKINLLINNIKAKKFIFKSCFDKYPHLFSKATNLFIIDENDIKLKNINLRHQVFIYKKEAYYTHLIFKQNRNNLVFLIEFLNLIGYHNLFVLIKRIKRVRGRLDLIYSRPYILIDYAHSPKSVENVLQQTSALKRNKIIVVIGAGGNRDKSKRKTYGEICLKYADEIYVCNDNPRDENPLSIAKDIAFNQDNKFNIILNRRTAINKAIMNANKEDIVLVLGRGNEEYQYFSNMKIPFSDYEECKKCLQNYHFLHR